MSQITTYHGANGNVMASTRDLDEDGGDPNRPDIPEITQADYQKVLDDYETLTNDGVKLKKARKIDPFAKAKSNNGQAKK